MQELIKRQLAFIGEDPGREGLIETPARILKSWDTLYSGYKQNPADIFTEFKSEGYDQMVLLRNIEMYSMCEHHMLPFFGKAHVAYLPGDRIVGISKLARLVDIYARRLQIQERLGEQITTALMEYLHPKGAACIIEAQHMCMLMRGVQKQNSILVTSSLKGEFLTDATLRAEFMSFIK